PTAPRVEHAPPTDQIGPHRERQTHLVGCERLAIARDSLSRGQSTEEEGRCPCDTLRASRLRATSPRAERRESLDACIERPRGCWMGILPLRVALGCSPVRRSWSPAAPSAESHLPRSVSTTERPRIRQHMDSNRDAPNAERHYPRLRRVAFEHPRERAPESLRSIFPVAVGVA